MKSDFQVKFSNQKQIYEEHIQTLQNENNSLKEENSFLKSQTDKLSQHNDQLNHKIHSFSEPSNDYPDSLSQQFELVYHEIEFLLHENEELKNTINEVSKQTQMLTDTINMLHNEANRFQEQNQFILRENEKLKDQLEQELQINKAFQKKILESQLIHQILTNLIDNFTLQSNDIHEEKEKIKIGFDQQLVEFSQMLQQLENAHQKQQFKHMGLKKKMISENNQSKSKLNEYLSSPTNEDSPQEELIV
jgi:chromosome segregation ATPase